MNRGDVKNRVRDAVGEPTERDTQIERWIDDAIHHIHTESTRWPWDMDTVSVFVRGPITASLTGDVTAGSVTIANVAGANEPTQAVADEYAAGGLVRVNGGNVYEISAWDVTTNDMTLVSAAVDTTATGVSLEVTLHDVIPLPATVDSVYDVMDSLTPQVLDRRKTPWNRFFPDPFDHIAQTPFWWDTNGVDASGNVRLALFPPPDANRNYLCEVGLRATLPTDDVTELETITRIPVKFHQAIVARTIYEAKKDDYERPEQLMEFGEYKDYIRRMKAFSRTEAGKIWVLQTRQRRVLNRNEVRFPSDFRVDT